MKKRKVILIVLFAMCLGVGMVYNKSAAADETLKFSCSAQLFDILQHQVLEDFTKQTGIYLDLFISSSEVALYRLYNRVSDVAGTAEPMDLSRGDYGYAETRICQAPIIVIAHPSCPVDTVTKEQLYGIFSGEITNWEILGAMKQEIVVVVPDKNTAAYRNFSQLTLKRFEIDYTIMTKRSTMVVQIVQNMPGSISFITKGSDQRDAAVKILKVDNIAHCEPNYPFAQQFSLVTRKQPDGRIKQFIDFITSEQTATSLRASGVLPVCDQQDK